MEGSRPSVEITRTGRGVRVESASIHGEGVGSHENRRGAHLQAVGPHGVNEGNPLFAGRVVPVVHRFL